MQRYTLNGFKSQSNGTSPSFNCIYKVTHDIVVLVDLYVSVEIEMSSAYVSIVARLFLIKFLSPVLSVSQRIIFKMTLNMCGLTSASILIGLMRTLGTQVLVFISL